MEIIHPNLHTGGYALIPETIEFWQGGPSRLHDRFLYRYEDGKWNIQTTKSMTKQNEDNKQSEDLNKLLSMRGKPFSDWKEERKYLREKWDARQANRSEFN